MGAGERASVARLDGRVAVVTGATGGLGEAICARLASEGAHVVVSDLDEDVCRALTERLNEAGGSARAWRLDVTHARAWTELAEELRATSWAGGVLVNNAGLVAPLVAYLLHDDCGVDHHFMVWWIASRGKTSAIRGSSPATSPRWSARGRRSEAVRPVATAHLRR